MHNNIGLEPSQTSRERAGIIKIDLALIRPSTGL
jgi:hypothetical protein